MNVSAIIVTRGNVDVQPVLDSLPDEWEKFVWDNGKGVCRTFKGTAWGVVASELPDLSVYGRYAAIEYASHELIYVQDDDVLVGEPQQIVQPLVGTYFEKTTVVCNMPQEFRHNFYSDHALVGFGAAFHRDLPDRAFRQFAGNVSFWQMAKAPSGIFKRTCDIIFTGLTPRLLVDTPKWDRPFASDPDRMWKQSDHVGERSRILDLVRAVA